MVMNSLAEKGVGWSRPTGETLRGRMALGVTPSLVARDDFQKGPSGNRLRDLGERHSNKKKNCSCESRLHFRHLAAFGILPPMCHRCKNARKIPIFFHPVAFSLPLCEKRHFPAGVTIRG